MTSSPTSLLAAVLVLAATALPLAAIGAETPAATSPSAAPAIVSQATVEGFRSAHFGMDESNVRKAIDSDFKLSAGAIRSERNLVQRTDALAITVPELIAGTGKADIHYVFGAKSHKLIEVNLTWSTAADPANTAQVLTSTGAVLQSYFLGEGFAPDKSAANIILPDGALVLFRGSDARGRAVVLTLAGTVRKGDSPQQTQMTPQMLSVAYAENPAQPDAFQLPRGSF